MASPSAIFLSREPAPQPPSYIPPSIQFTLDGSFLLALPVVAWLVWDRLLSPSLGQRLGSFLVPVKEERRLQTLTAQIGAITRASRVVLTGFHNGALDTEGYHLQKISSLTSYVRDGCRPMSQPINNLPLARISYELGELGKVPGWATISNSDDLPRACRDHLISNDICHMSNRLIRVGNLPIGILSLQYISDEGFEGNPSFDAYAGLLEDLYDQIVTVLRSRLLHPSPVKRIADQVFGTLKV